MEREEAIEMLKALNMMLRSPDGEPISDVCDALGMAIEALSADTISRKDTVTLNSPISIQVTSTQVVRCKDCRHRDLFSCPLADNDFQKDEDFCSWGERREP